MLLYAAVVLAVLVGVPSGLRGERELRRGLRAGLILCVAELAVLASVLPRLLSATVLVGMAVIALGGVLATALLCATIVRAWRELRAELCPAPRED